MRQKSPETSEERLAQLEELRVVTCFTRWR